MNISYKGMMKRKIVEILVVHKKDGGMSTKIADKLMLEFYDCDKNGGTLNEIFPLVITVTVGDFDVS